jgi:hypothetical protein
LLDATQCIYELRIHALEQIPTQQRHRRSTSGDEASGHQHDYSDNE